jgi:hypothetical protein
MRLGNASPDQVHRLAALMPARPSASVHVAAGCGLRLGEVLGLEVETSISARSGGHAGWEPGMTAASGVVAAILAGANPLVNKLLPG